MFRRLFPYSNDHRKLLIGLLIGAIGLFVFGSLWVEHPRSRSGAGEDRAEHVVARPTPTVLFGSDYNAGLEEAANRKRPVLLFFMAPDCPFSRKMLRETFTDPDVRGLAEGFVCVEIDINAPGAESLCQHFGVNGSPTVQFISSKGTQLRKLSQFQPASELKREMEVVLTSMAWRPTTLATRPSSSAR